MTQRFLKQVFRLLRFVASENGSDLVEYVLVMALVAFGVTASLAVAANGLNRAFNHASQSLSRALAQTDPDHPSGGDGGSAGHGGGQSGSGQGGHGSAGGTGGGGGRGNGGSGH
jgi:Flp pilus assembly pilin Flp